MGRRWQRLADRATEATGTALLASLIAGLLGSATATLALLDSIQVGPPVGEILSFGPYAQPAPVWSIAAVRAGDRRHCMLKPAFMANAPGSLVVEARSADGRTFRVHWAGGPTSDHATDCGSAADLEIGLSAMQTLVNADAMSHQHWSFMPS